MPGVDLRMVEATTAFFYSIGDRLKFGLEAGEDMPELVALGAQV
jgi:hypothetical protein